MGKVGSMMLDQAAKLATIEGIHHLSLLDLNEESDLKMTWNSLHTAKDEIRKRTGRRRELLSILGQRMEDVPLDQEQASFIGQHFSPHSSHLAWEKVKRHPPPEGLFPPIAGMK
jgi:hypothetical protein